MQYNYEELDFVQEHKKIPVVLNIQRRTGIGAIKHTITITRKSDGSVVRVMKAVHYFVDLCEDFKEGIPNISVLYEDRDGNYRTAFYPLVLFDFEILDD